MAGSMQDWPLLVWKLLDHAAAISPGQEIVTQSVEGPLHRINWRDLALRARRLAKSLATLGIEMGDRVATIAWNTHRHVECLYGISGIGAVAHTINPRLFEEQLVYIINHAEDRILFLDLTFVELIERIAPKLTSVEHFVLLTDRAHMADSSLDLLCYEDLIADADADFRWADLDETAPAGLCYTSGTTGNPKGVLYTHRSNVLHAFGATQPNVFGLSQRSTVLPIVPMFHANAWGIPYAAALAGAKLVLNGPNNDPVTIQRLIVEEGVTVTAAVPTVWLAMLQHLRDTGGGLGLLERMIIGGSAAPRSMIETIERDYGVEAVQAWGMTETSPLGTTAPRCSTLGEDDPDRRMDLRCKQGRPLFGIELKIDDDDGRALPHDGRTPGNLKLRGPWVIQRYYRADRDAVDADGWFDTGDIATIDDRSFMNITDRSKDVIKSGGEWISSIELENAAVGCPGIAEAAVIGIPHPRWTERPLLILVRAPSSDVGEDAVRAHLADKVAKWWMPDRVIFVDSIPHTATGKILKTALRDLYGETQ